MSLPSFPLGNSVLNFYLGGSQPTTTTEADVWASDLLAVTFVEPMKNDSVLQNPETYTVVPLDGGIPVRVIGVQTGNELNPRVIYLIVTQFSIGKLYRIDFQSLFTIEGSSVATVSAKFIGRQTKQDSIINSRPLMYDMSPDSTLRKVLQAIGRQDDLIGGSRKDKIF